MAETKIFGIKNCDTMKKAFRWLEENDIAYSFHDYKASGIDRNVLEDALQKHGWEKVLNTRGTTWRQLPEEVKSTMDNSRAIEVANENPSIIKRPLLARGQDIHLGFKEEEYKALYG